MALVERRNAALRNHAQQRARHARVKLPNSTPNVVLFEQRLVTLLVLPLDVIEK
jgi:hypothetical protein